MSQDEIPSARQGLTRALFQLNQALEILDSVGAPGDIGSSLDLAIARLEKQLGVDGSMAAQVDILLARLFQEQGTGGAVACRPSGLTPLTLIQRKSGIHE
jgi:hypothetical protein